LRKLLTAALLIALTICFSCKTTKPVPSAEAQKALAVLAPPMPQPPVMEKVRFEDYGDGLWLSYNDYRALERNIIAMREYAARLEIIIKFYWEGQ